MSQEYFPKIKPVSYERPKTKNRLAFRHYNPDEVVGKKTMREHLRFSLAYWHALKGGSSDPFGGPTRQRPWDDGSTSIDNAKRVADAGFEMMQKLGLGFYCFHDRDVAPELDDPYVWTYSTDDCSLSPFTDSQYHIKHSALPSIHNTTPVSEP